MYGPGCQAPGASGPLRPGKTSNRPPDRVGAPGPTRARASGPALNGSASLNWWLWSRTDPGFQPGFGLSALGLARSRKPKAFTKRLLTNRPEEYVRAFDPEVAIGFPVGRHRKPVRNDACAGLGLTVKLRLQPRVDVGRKEQPFLFNSGSISMPTPRAPYFLAASITMRPSPDPRS